jgi:hypothetical protein
MMAMYGAFPFFGLLAAQYTARNQTLALQWQGAQVRIGVPIADGPKTTFSPFSYPQVLPFHRAIGY